MATIAQFLKRIRDFFFLPKGAEQTPSPFLKGGATKLIFDHLRNMTLCTVVAQIGLTAQSFGGSSEVARGVAQIYGYAFLGVAICLFGLNLMHGEHLLKWSPAFKTLRESKMFGVIEKTYWFVYCALAIPAFLVRLMGLAA